MKNPNLNYFFDTCVWHIKKGTSISVRTNDGYLSDKGNWNHTERTTRDLWFDSREVHREDVMNITFKRCVNGRWWFLKINKTV